MRGRRPVISSGGPSASPLNRVVAVVGLGPSDTVTAGLCPTALDLSQLADVAGVGNARTQAARLDFLHVDGRGGKERPD